MFNYKLAKGSYKKTCLVLALVLAVVLTGCGQQVADEQQEWTQKVNDKLIQVGKIPKVGVVLSKTDSAMNQLVLNSLAQASNSRTIELREVFPNEIPKTEEAVQYLAENNCAVIIGLPADYIQIANKLGKNYPNTTFVSVDNELTGDNTLSLLFKEEEGGFLAGVLAAMVNKTGIVGFVGGKVDDPQVVAYQAGYYQGVKYVNQKFDQDVRIQSNFVGYFDKDIVPERAKNITVQQYTYGAGLIFQVAGKASEGVFQGAKEKGGLVIGSDVNQNARLPGSVPASIVKSFDTVIKNVINQFALGKTPRGVLVYSLKNNGMRITDMRNLETAERLGVKQKQGLMDDILKAKNSVPDDVIVELQQVRADISQGTIKINDQLSKEFIQSLAPVPKIQSSNSKDNKQEQSQDTNKD